MYGSEEAWRWESSGADGYTVTPCDKDNAGTVIVLHLKEDTEDEKYSDYLNEYQLRSLVKKYSDYIRYPIRMQVSHQQKKEGSEEEYETVIEDETLNSMIPLWKKPASDVSDEEYAQFYQDKFYDYEAPLKVIRQKAEGNSNYEALLFLPAHAPFNYYSKDYEKGLQLYSSGVLIMDKCKDLIPDHFSFVRGLVDSADLSLNISREMLQQDRQLKVIARALEKIAFLPQVESVTGHGYEVLYLTEDVDEFALQMLRTYDEKEFLNVCSEKLELESDEDKEKLKSENEKASELFSFMKESIGDSVAKVQYWRSI